MGTVAGEYAEVIKAHLPEIVGITAAFILAEAASMLLAATPTGVGQLAALVIQLALAAFGAAGAVEAGAEALKHAENWLTTAWTAKGDAGKIEEASKEFLKMLVSIAMAALAVMGVRANLGRATKIASAIEFVPPRLAMAESVSAGGAMTLGNPVFFPGAITSTGPVFTQPTLMTAIGAGGGKLAEAEAAAKRATEAKAAAQRARAEAEAKHAEASEATQRGSADAAAKQAEAKEAARRADRAEKEATKAASDETTAKRVAEREAAANKLAEPADVRRILGRAPDEHEVILFKGRKVREVEEMAMLIEGWSKRTYDSPAHSVLNHAQRKNFDPLLYLRKVNSFNRRGARDPGPKPGKDIYKLEHTTTGEFLELELGTNKIVTYGFNMPQPPRGKR